MQARSVTLAIAALALWLIPSGSLAQGNSGETRLTICHIPPGNSDARRTVTVSEPAWRSHESHGDTLGPCNGYSEGHRDGYGADTERAKKAKKRKEKKEYRGGSDGDAADDEMEADDRAGGRDEVDETDERARTEQRRAERRERGSRDRSEATTDASQTDDPGGKKQTDDSGGEKRGFFRGMQQFFGFGADESEE